MATLKHGNKQAEGGKRSNAGRKPKAATILKRRLIEDKVTEAELSFAFLVAVRDNSEEPSNLRLAAAEQILDRVLGKPSQMQPKEGDAIYKEHLARLRQVIFDESTETSRPEGNQSSGSTIPPTTSAGTSS